MKKVFFGAMLFATASLHTVSATSCAASGTLSSFASLSSGCQITTTAGTYTLTNWWLGSQSGSFSPQISGNDILVSISASANSFVVDFSASGSGSQFFNLTSGQHVGFRSGFWVLPTSGGPYPSLTSTVGTDSAALQELGTTGTATFNTSTTLQNFAGTTTLFRPLHVYYSGANSGCSNNNASCFGITTNPDSISYNLYNGGFSVLNIAYFSALAGQSGSLTSYRNTFTAPAPAPDPAAVPEPVTLLLMGAGLVGIAALRRRQG